MTLTKSEIVDDLSSSEYTRKRAVKILENLLELIKRTLESGEDVLISGFGKFSVKQKNERRGRNPATGDDLILSERSVVTFTCSPILRKKINK